MNTSENYFLKLEENIVKIITKADGKYLSQYDIYRELLNELELSY